MKFKVDISSLTYLGTLGTGDKGLADVPLGEDGGSLDVIPILLCERIDTAHTHAAKPEPGHLQGLDEHA
jgi:hypothetical protein